jgi:hypothetical protein
MRPRALEMSDDRLALGDQVDDLHLEIRKRALKRTDPTPSDWRKPAGRDLTENIEVSITTPSSPRRRTNSLFSSADTQLPSSRAGDETRTRRDTAAPRNSKSLYDTQPSAPSSRPGRRERTALGLARDPGVTRDRPLRREGSATSQKPIDDRTFPPAVAQVQRRQRDRLTTNGYRTPHRARPGCCFSIKATAVSG